MPKIKNPKKPNKTRKNPIKPDKTQWVGFFQKNPGFFQPCHMAMLNVGQGHMVCVSQKNCSAVGRIRTYAPRGKLISSQSP